MSNGPVPASEASLSQQLLRGLREGALLVLAMLALYFLVALLSFHPDDPSWSFTGDGEAVRNLGGSAGAWFADVSLYVLGYLAYGIPLSLLAIGIWLFRNRFRPRIASPLEFLLRGMAWVVALTTGAGLAALHVLPGDLPVHAGGVLGDLVGRPAATGLGLVGATLFLLALFFAALTLLTGISWFALMDRLGEGVFAVGSRGQALWSNLRWRRVGAETPLPRDPRVEQEHSRLRPRHSVRVEPILEPPEFLTGIRPMARSKASGPPAQPGESAGLPALGVGGVSIDGAGSVVRGTVVAEGLAATASALPATQPGPTAGGGGGLMASATALAARILPRAQRAPVSVAESFVPNDPHPALSLMDPIPAVEHGYTPEYLEEMSRLVEVKLRDFGVSVEVTTVQPGPVITRFELVPAPGVKVARISALAKDLARSLSVLAVRIVEVIPGRSTVGLEIPNEKRELVSLAEILQSEQFTAAKSMLTVALGKDIGGAPVVADLARMPHLLVAGTTGSGKSVGVNAMLISMLYKATAEEVRLILIDPKMLELSVYEGIPHLLAPVVTDMKDAANALRWAVAEMERRYKLMSMLGVRNIAGYNKKVRDAEAIGEPLLDPTFDPQTNFTATEAPALKTLPFIVVVVDEFADMIMVVGKKVEELIARLAQKARAAGIHLILATQRPSVDVITGLIKANIPSRIAFQVSSRVDSRTILDQMGAEHLLGHGDMLYLPPGKAIPERVHGAFVADHEVHKVVEFLLTTGEPDYEPAILEEPEAGAPSIPGLDLPSADAEGDPLYDQAVQIVMETRKASISYIQRRLKIGYNRAARMIEDMETAGLVSPVQSNGNREVLVPGRE